MIRIVLVALGLVLMPLASAQSLNIDLDEGFASPPEGGGVPSSAFGAAAGQSGFWNSIEAGGATSPTSLRTLSGTLSDVTIQASGGIGSAGGFNFGGNTGNYALLLNDYADISNANTYTFNGLSSGDYVVYSYAVDPSGTMRNISVQISGSQEGIQSVTGPMPGNSFVQGVTHSVHHLHVSTGSISITLSTTAINPVHGVNGFQVVAVPEPSTFIVGLSGLAVCIRKRKGAN